MKYIIGSLIALVILLTPSVSQVNFGGPGGSFGGVFDAALNYLSGTVSDGCAEWSSNQLTSTGSDCNSGGSFGQAFELTTNIFSQSALTPTTTQNLLINGTGTSTFAGGLEAWRQIAAPYFQATSTATSTFAGPITMVHPNHLTVHAIRGDASDGLTLKASNYATVATFGAAGGQNITFPGYTSALLQTGSGGAVQEYSGTSCTNQFVRSLSALGIATCATVANTDLANSTISGISLGSNLADLTATDTTLTFSGSYNGGTARTVGLNLGNANSWTALQTFANATTTLLSANYASSTLYYGAGLQTCNATTGKLAWANGQFTCETDQTGGASFGQAWNEFASGYIAPTSTVGVVIGATTTPSFAGTALFQVNATNTTQTLIKASSTPLFTGKYLDITNNFGNSILTLDADGILTLSDGSDSLNFSLDDGVYGTSNFDFLFETGNVAITAGTGLYISSNNSGINASLDTSSLTTSDKTFSFPDKSGTFILSGDTFTGDVTATLDTDGSTALAIGSGVIIEPDLNADNSPSDGDYLQYDSTGTNFVWRTAANLVSDISSALNTAITTLSNLTTVGALNAGSITSGFGNIDNGSSNLTSGGTITFGGLSDGLIRVTSGVLAGAASINAGEYSAASIDGDDINSNIAGRSLTLTAGSPDTLDLDSEIYTRSSSANLIATSSNQIATSTETILAKKFDRASTLTGVYCKTFGTGTSTVDVKINGSTSIFGGIKLVCGSQGDGSTATTEVASTTLSVTAISSGDYLEISVPDAEPTGARPRMITVTPVWTIND